MVAANRTLPIMAGETIRAAQRDVSHGVFGSVRSVTELKWLQLGTRPKLPAQVVKTCVGWSDSVSPDPRIADEGSGLERVSVRPECCGGRRKQLCAAATSTQIKSATSVLITGLPRAPSHVGRGGSRGNTKTPPRSPLSSAISAEVKAFIWAGSSVSSRRRSTAFNLTGSPRRWSNITFFSKV